MKNRAFAFILLFFCASFPLYSQNFLSKVTWFANGSLLFFTENNGLHSAPMQVQPSFGAGASYPVKDIFKTELTLDFYTALYGYSNELERAVSASVEHRTARVFSSLLGMQAGKDFTAGNVTFRGYGGLAAVLRLVLPAKHLKSSADTIDDIQDEVGKVRSYLWSNGRWLLPLIGVGLDYAPNSQLKIGFDTRLWFPLYKLWSNEKLPAAEGWRFGTGIRLTIR